MITIIIGAHTSSELECYRQDKCLDQQGGRRTLALREEGRIGLLDSTLRTRVYCF